MKKRNPPLICHGKDPVGETQSTHRGNSFKHFRATNLIGGKQTHCVDKHRLGLSRAFRGLWGEYISISVHNVRCQMLCFRLQRIFEYIYPYRYKYVSIFYLLRREYTNCATIFPHCHTHFCQQGLSVDEYQREIHFTLYNVDVIFILSIIFTL